MPAKKSTTIVPPPASFPSYDPTNPFIIQSDRTILVEVDNPKYAEARDALSPFAELEKSPEHVHTYRISNLSLWNAAAAGMTARQMVEVLMRFTKFPIPPTLPLDLEETVARYGRVQIQRHDGGLKLVCQDGPLLAELVRQKKVAEYLGEKIDASSYSVDSGFRGLVKQALIVVGYPAEDLAGYTAGADLAMELRTVARSGLPFDIRDYQKNAVDVFLAGGDVRGGSGVIVLPCGAGKTIVGIGAMTKLQKSTLILTTSTTAVKQWRREILDKTSLTDDQVTEYTGDSKVMGPVTVATYQIVTYRPDKTEDFPHFKLFDARDWGLIVYDEVHLLPAPVFRATANIQARRRIGLTATLIREDGREGDVFTLIGPKKYDVPWRQLETKGWIAAAECCEIRVSLPDDASRLAYATAELRNKHRIASENPAKEEVVAELLSMHEDQRVIIIGQYLSQLKSISKRFDIPLITGATKNDERETLYDQFRRGEIRSIVLSKVGNFAIDLPDANVLIQVSGTFGSRQEEAQRLGRVLRPKADGGGASFYSIVTRDTKELDFAHHRQMFLTEQGYGYDIRDEREVLPAKSTSPVDDVEIVESAA